MWDSKEAKSAYKEKVFNGKRTYRDPVTGKELHIAEKAARNKFHMKTADGKNNSTAWAAHSAEADPVSYTPLDVYKRQIIRLAPSVR